MTGAIRFAWLLGAAPVAALAAESAHHGDVHAAPSITTLLWPVLNFAIFAWILYRYAWPAVRHALAERRAAIERGLTDAARAHEEAKAALAEIQARRASLDDEGRRILEQLRAEGEREAAALVDAARQAAERLRADARLLGEQEAARAAQSIRAQVAETVVERVLDRLRREPGRIDQGAFAAEFLRELDAGAAR